MKEEPKIVAKATLKCPFCHDQVSPSASKTGCESCMAWHHQECWDSHGACSACGFQRTDSQRKRSQTISKAANGSCENESCVKSALGRSEFDYCSVWCEDHALKQLKKNRRAGNVFFVASLALLGYASYESWDHESRGAILTMGVALLVFATGFMIHGFQKIRGLEQQIWFYKDEHSSDSRPSSKKST